MASISRYYRIGSYKQFIHFWRGKCCSSTTKWNNITEYPSYLSQIKMFFFTDDRPFISLNILTYLISIPLKIFSLFRFVLWIYLIFFLCISKLQQFFDFKLSFYISSLCVFLFPLFTIFHSFKFVFFNVFSTIYRKIKSFYLNSIEILSLNISCHC